MSEYKCVKPFSNSKCSSNKRKITENVRQHLDVLGISAMENKRIYTSCYLNLINQSTLPSGSDLSTSLTVGDDAVSNDASSNETSDEMQTDQLIGASFNQDYVQTPNLINIERDVLTNNLNEHIVPHISDHLSPLKINFCGSFDYRKQKAVQITKSIQERLTGEVLELSENAKIRQRYEEIIRNLKIYFDNGDYAEKQKMLSILPQEMKMQDIQDIFGRFLSWNSADCQVDLEEELNTITLQAPEGEEARHGERLIQYASENLVTEILIHPQYNTLIQCMRNLLSSFTRHRHIIHAGYTFSGNGSWILQDGTFSVSDFSEAFQENDVQRVLRAYPDTITMDIHCESIGLWSSLPDKNFAKSCRIRINPIDVLNSGSDKINAFIDYLAPMALPASLTELLESSDVVGNIRFSHPTLYVFPGGQGDAALFGINGFNMLVDGGFGRKACFWDFTRHLDRLDAVLMTRISNCNINGLGAVVERKRGAHVYPQIGHFFCNIPERKGSITPDGDKDKDPLLIRLHEKGHQLVSNLRAQNLQPQTCYRDSEPINLYHKVGHGTLDMYVLSPSRDAKEVKEFLQKWNSNDPKLFTPKDTKEFVFPIQNLISVCALLVWLPANPDDSITRILFPGSTPDYKIIEGLEKIKHLEFMKHPTCTTKTIAPSISTASLVKKTIKSVTSEKGGSDLILPPKPIKSFDNKIMDNKMKAANGPQSVDNKVDDSVELRKKETGKPVSRAKPVEQKKIDNKLAESEKSSDIIKEIESAREKEDKEKVLIDEKENTNKPDSDKTLDEEEKDVGEEKIIETETKLVESETVGKKDELETVKLPHSSTKSKPILDQKPKKPETKASIRSRIDSKPPKSMDKRPAAPKKEEKKEISKSSPTTTPKKTSVPKEAKEVKPKILSRVTRSSPSGTPAKSAKDANNRKVLESKQKAVPVKKETAPKPTEKKEITKLERKPISRRPKTESPSRRPQVGSPIKTARPARTKAEKDKKKLDKGGTTDSSLVSTPSAEYAGIAKKIIEIEAQPEIKAGKIIPSVDDLKEEQEAVREIEAVFSRDSVKPAKTEPLSGHREVVEIGKQDSTTEGEEDEEYLIIEKEEVEQYTEDSINEQDSLTKEEEIQKHQRDSEESEKKRKLSAEEIAEEKLGKAKVVEIIEGEDADKDVVSEKKDDDGDMQPDSIEDDRLPNKEQLKEEVQDIITSAKEIAKTRTESRDEIALKTEEFSTPSLDEKVSSTKKTSDETKDEEIEDGGEEGIVPNIIEQSQPDEKFSATIESGATTAPTLPEDERIPLDEIKEDLDVIEEKYAKEETKENETPSTIAQAQKQKPSAPTHESVERAAIPTQIKFDMQHSHLRDIVKTPDEVADLPVHEEVDYVVGYDDYHHQQNAVPSATAGKKHEIEKKTDSDKNILKNVEAQIVVEPASVRKMSSEQKSVHIESRFNDVTDMEELAKKVEEFDKIVPTKIEKPAIDGKIEQELVEDIKTNGKDKAKKENDDEEKEQDAKDVIANEKDDDEGKGFVEQLIDVIKKEKDHIVENVKGFVGEKLTPKGVEDLVDINELPSRGVEEKLDKSEVEEIVNELEKEGESLTKKIEAQLKGQNEDLDKNIDNGRTNIEETKEHLDKEKDSIMDKIEKKIEEVKENVETKVNETKEKVENIKEDVEKKVEDAWDKITGVKDAIAPEIESVTEKIEKETEDVKQKLTTNLDKAEEKIETILEKEKSEIEKKTDDFGTNVTEIKTKIAKDAEMVKGEIEMIKEGVEKFMSKTDDTIIDEIDKNEEKINEKLSDTKDKVEKVSETAIEEIEGEIKSVLKDEKTIKEVMEKIEQNELTQEEIDIKMDEVTEIKIDMEKKKDDIKDRFDEISKIGEKLDDMKNKFVNFNESVKINEHTKENVTTTVDKEDGETKETSEQVNELKEDIVNTDKTVNEKIKENEEEKSEIGKIDDKKEKVIDYIEENVGKTDSEIEAKIETKKHDISKATESIFDKIAESSGIEFIKDGVVTVVDKIENLFQGETISEIPDEDSKNTEQKLSGDDKLKKEDKITQLGIQNINETATNDATDGGKKNSVEMDDTPKDLTFKTEDDIKLEDKVTGVKEPSILVCTDKTMHIDSFEGVDEEDKKSPVLSSSVKSGEKVESVKVDMKTPESPISQINEISTESKLPIVNQNTKSESAASHVSDGKVESPPHSVLNFTDAMTDSKLSTAMEIINQNIDSQKQLDKNLSDTKDHIPSSISEKLESKAENFIVQTKNFTEDVKHAKNELDEKLGTEIKQIKDDAITTASDIKAELQKNKEQAATETQQIKDDAITIASDIKAELQKTKETAAIKIDDASVEVVKEIETKINDVKAVVNELVDTKKTEFHKTTENIATTADATIKDTKNILETEFQNIADTTDLKLKEIDEKLNKTKDQVSQFADTTIKSIDTKIEEGKNQISTELEKAKDEIQVKAKSSVSSFFGGISQGIKSGIDKLTDKLEEKIKDKPDEADVSQKLASSYEIKGFPTELRETHITTLDSPIIDQNERIGEIKTLEKLAEKDEDVESEANVRGDMKFQIEEVRFASPAFEREESSLNDIKEENEEDDHFSPPGKIGDSVKRLSDDKLEPPRSVSPRERTPEDVIKIVANVAEVLKSDKDLEEIIPDFDPEELEKKLSARASPVRTVDICAQQQPKFLQDEECDDDQITKTVKRMLVTASSEDGGGEIEICPPGSIVFESASGAVTPDTRSGRHSPVDSDKENEPLNESNQQETEKYETTTGKLNDDLMEETSIPRQDEEQDLNELHKLEKTESSTSIKSVTDDSKADKFPESSGKSTPELKTSPISIDEKEKHEISEKAQKLPNITSTQAEPRHKLDDSRKESIKSDHVDSDFHSRRESAISTFSEKDLTREESSIGIDDKDLSATSHASDKSIEDLKDEIEKGSTKVVDATDGGKKNSVEMDDTPKDLTFKTEDDIKLEDKVTDVKEPSILVCTDKTLHIDSFEGVDEVDKKSPVLASSVKSDEKVESVKVDMKTPESPISQIDEISTESKLPTVNQNTKSESAASHVSDGKVESPPHSVLNFTDAMTDSKLSAENSQPDFKSQTQNQEVQGKLSHKDTKENDQILNQTPTKILDEKDSRSGSGVSEVFDGKSISEKSESRPESAASHVSFEPEKADDKLDQNVSPMKIESRSESVTSNISGDVLLPTKSESEKQTDSKSHKSDSHPELDASQTLDATPETKLLTEILDMKPEADQKAEVKEESRSESKLSQISDTTPEQKEHDSRSSLDSKLKDDVKSNLKLLPEKIESELKLSESHFSEKKSEGIEKSDLQLSPDNLVPKSDCSPSKVDDSLKSYLESLSEKLDSQPDPIISQILDTKSTAEKTEFRPESAASHVSDTNSTIDDKPDLKLSQEKLESRPESGASSHITEKSLNEEAKSVSQHSSPTSSQSPGEKSEIKLDSKISQEKPDSRPLSVLSHTSDTQLDATIDSKTSPEKPISRPESVASNVSDIKSDTHLSLETSKGDAIDKSDLKLSLDSNIPLPDAAASETNEITKSRSASVTSRIEEIKVSENKTDLKLSPEKSESPGSQITETKADSIAKPGKQDEHIETQVTVTQPQSRPDSVASHISDTRSDPISLKEKHDEDKEKKSRSGSITSITSDKHDLPPSRPISQASNISEKFEHVKLDGTPRSPSALSDEFDEEIVHPATKTVMKETRSKSVASIMTGSIYKGHDGKQPLSAFTEAQEYSKDDSDILGKYIGSSKNSLTHEDIVGKEKLSTSKSNVTEDLTNTVSILDQIWAAQQSDPKQNIVENVITTTSSGIRSSSSKTSPSGKSLSGKSTPDIADVIIMSSNTAEPVDSPKDNSIEEGRKTPPTVPVSPNIKTEFSMTQSMMIPHFTDAGVSSPKELLSGKSSPGLLQTCSDSASKSTSVGHGSGMDTSDSSPKPTSPFPKGIQSVKSEDGKTSSGISTPDMTRMSTPDITEQKINDKSDPGSDSVTTITTTTAPTKQFIDGIESSVEKIEKHVSEATQLIEKTDNEDPTSTTHKSSPITIPPLSKDISNLKSSEFRSFTPGSDDYDIHDVSSPRSDISSGQASRVITGWTPGSSEERRYSDDEIPSSPMSGISHVAHSPILKFAYEDPYDLHRSASGTSIARLDIDESQDDIPPQYGSEEVKSAISIPPSYRSDPMSASFYGALPDTKSGKSEPIPITQSSASVKSHLIDYMSFEASDPLASMTSSVASRDSEIGAKLGNIDHKFLDEADLDFEKALEEHRLVRGADVMSSITSKYEYSPTKTLVDTSKQESTIHESKGKEGYTNGKEFLLDDIQKSSKQSDILTPSTTTSVTTTSTVSSTSPSQSTQQISKEKEDFIASWGQPLGLPSPAPIPVENNTTPKKERRMMVVNSKTKLNNEKNLRKRSESPGKGLKTNPIYMDLTYVPHHGNSYYSHVEFFKRVRARYYVFSGTEPSRDVYNALLEAKQTWEDKDLEVTIIPTYDTDVLGFWVSENEDLLAKSHIDLSPSASRCTINLQDHETSCSAYRLEF